MGSTERSPVTDLDKISQIPWCARLLSDGSFSTVITKTRTPKSNTQDAFFGHILKTDNTISACLTQQREPTEEATPDSPPFPAIPELRVFLTLGTDINGHAHMAHGGFVATVMDQAIGMLMTANKDYELRRPQINVQEGEVHPWQRVTAFTMSLQVFFKKPLFTPDTVLVRSFYDRVEGKRHYCKATIENGEGVVYAEGLAVFLKLEAKL